ncbi:MAG: N-acetylneuraminate synthase family protein, partial [Acidobacteriota bacterium]
IGMPAFKIPSGELTNAPMLAHIARKGKPMIVSTGMATLGEVEAAIEGIRADGCDDMAVLHCVSNYPADPADVNLRAMETMARAFGLPVGYSDHTLGLEISLAAVALGATIIEKHFTLDRTLPGPDHAASLEPFELSALVRGIRSVERALGDGRKRPAESERDSAESTRRSIVASRDIAAGEVLSNDILALRRPGTGLAPRFQGAVVGRTVIRDVRAGELIALSDLR